MAMNYVDCVFSPSLDPNDSPELDHRTLFKETDRVFNWPTIRRITGISSEDLVSKMFLVSVRVNLKKKKSKPGSSGIKDNTR